MDEQQAATGRLEMVNRRQRRGLVEVVQFVSAAESCWAFFLLMSSVWPNSANFPRRSLGGRPAKSIKKRDEGGKPASQQQQQQTDRQTDRTKQHPNGLTPETHERCR